MSLISLFKKTAVPGGLLLPRHVARRGQLNWPKCMRCGRAVDAYGIANETDGSIEVWARCGGTRIDPSSGNAVHGYGRNHPEMKGSITIMKGPGYSANRFTQILAEMAFFPADGGDRAWTQTLTPDGVARRWGAG